MARSNFGYFKFVSKITFEEIRNFFPELWPIANFRIWNLSAKFLEYYLR